MELESSYLCVNGGCSGIQGSERSSFGPSPRTSGENNGRYRALGISESPNRPLDLGDICPIPAGSGGHSWDPGLQNRCVEVESLWAFGWSKTEIWKGSTS